jgi:hypothetical protein
MKIKPEHYSELKSDIDNLISKHGKDTFIKQRAEVSFVKNQFVSFVWSVFWVIDYSKYRKLYDYMNDDNIETALKSILSEFK